MMVDQKWKDDRIAEMRVKIMGRFTPFIIKYFILAQPNPMKFFNMVVADVREAMQVEYIGMRDSLIQMMQAYPEDNMTEQAILEYVEWSFEEALKELKEEIFNDVDE